MTGIKMRAKYVRIVRGDPSGVAARWKDTYFKDGKWNDYGPSKEDVYNKLLGLTTSRAIEQVIGNKSWTCISCSGCSEHMDTAIAIGTGDYEETSKYCGTCIQEAYALLLEGE